MVPAVPVPLSVSGKTVRMVAVSGSGSVPEPGLPFCRFAKSHGYQCAVATWSNVMVGRMASAPACRRGGGGK